MSQAKSNTRLRISGESEEMSFADGFGSGWDREATVDFDGLRAVEPEVLRLFALRAMPVVVVVKVGGKDGSIP